MTLIAGLADVNKGVCLFGDLMLTADAIGSRNVPYPTRPTRFYGDNHLPIDTSVVGLVQKIEIYNRHITAGFAGNLEDAKRLSGYLRDQIGKHSYLSSSEVQKLLNDYAADHQDSAVEMVLLHMDPSTGHLSCIHPGTAYRNVSNVGDVYAIGKGSADFWPFMTQYVSGRYAALSENGPAAGAYIGPTVMLEFMHHMMDGQQGAGWGVKNSWGGGCELVYRSESGFERIGSVLYQSFVVRRKSGTLEVGEVSKTCQQYDMDELIVKTSRADLKSTEIHIVPALYRCHEKSYKQSYYDYEFDHPLFTLTKMRNVDTNQYRFYGQHCPNGDEKVLMGDPNSWNWLTYDLKFIEALAIEKGL